MKKQPTAILTGDIQLHPGTPICRTDDFQAAMWRKVQWLRELQEEYQCPILDSGDVLEHPKVPPWMETKILRFFPKEFYTVPGNHDLPNHNLSLLDQSSMAVLWEGGAINVVLSPLNMDLFSVYPFPWGEPLKPLRTRNKQVSVAICHIMTFQGESPWPGADCLDAKTLLRTMRGYDLILTGHNHKPFIEESNGRLLINPGSLLRTTADQIDYEPCVWLWYAEENEVEPVYIPIEKGVISREHIDRKKDKDERMAAYVEKLDGGYDISNRFEINREAFFATNKVRKSVQDIVMECTGE